MPQCSGCACVPAWRSQLLSTHLLPSSRGPPRATIGANTWEWIRAVRVIGSYTWQYGMFCCFYHHVKWGVSSEYQGDAHICLARPVTTATSKLLKGKVLWTSTGRGGGHREKLLIPWGVKKINVFEWDNQGGAWKTVGTCVQVKQTENRAGACHCRTVTAPPASAHPPCVFQCERRQTRGHRDKRGESQPCVWLVQNGKRVRPSVLGAAVSRYATLTFTGLRKPAEWSFTAPLVLQKWNAGRICNVAKDIQSLCEPCVSPFIGLLTAVDLTRGLLLMALCTTRSHSRRTAHWDRNL